MSEEIVYIDYDEALTIYGKMIDASDGGFEGVRDEGGIRATLDFVQNDSNIDQDLLLRIVNSFLTSKDYDEELKIDIANAMSKGELGIQGEDYEKD